MYVIVIGFLVVGVCIGALIVTIVFLDDSDSYYRGQIDAIRGIIKWELKRNSDGEEVWTEIKK